MGKEILLSEKECELKTSMISTGVQRACPLAHGTLQLEEMKVS